MLYSCLAFVLCTVAGMFDLIAAQNGLRATIGEDKFSSDARKLIIGGKVVPDASKYPWFVSVRRNTTGHWCGGALLSSYHVLSCGHCYDEHVNWTPDKVIVNAYKRNDEGYLGHQILEIDDIIFHPKYKNSAYEFEYDAVIFVLKSPADTTNMMLPRIADPGTENPATLPEPSTIVTVLGMGQTGDKNNAYMTDTLKEVRLKTWSHEACFQKFVPLYGPRIKEDSQVCAGKIDKNIDADACRGDSGGPLFSGSTNDVVIFGIVSHSAGCARDGDWPSVYARVSALHDWLCNDISPSISGCSGPVSTEPEPEHVSEPELETEPEPEPEPQSESANTSANVVRFKTIHTGSSECGDDEDDKKFKYRGNSDDEWCPILRALVNKGRLKVSRACRVKDVENNCKALCCPPPQSETVSNTRDGRRPAPDGRERTKAAPRLNPKKNCTGHEKDNTRTKFWYKGKTDNWCQYLQEGEINSEEACTSSQIRLFCGQSCCGGMPGGQTR